MRRKPRRRTRLEDFLHEVEGDAKAMGFDPVLVLNAAFDTRSSRSLCVSERQACGWKATNSRAPCCCATGRFGAMIPVHGSCRVIPRRGLILVVTNDQKFETVFGFFQFPPTLKDLNGKDVVKTGIGYRWTHRDLVDSPDPRYRRIVKRFTECGYTEFERG